MELGHWLMKRMISAIIVEHYFPPTSAQLCCDVAGPISKGFRVLF